MLSILTLPVCCARAAADDELLPGEMRISLGRDLLEPHEFPTLKELIERVEQPELQPAIMFRFYGDEHNYYVPQWSRDGSALAVLRSDINAHTSKILLLTPLDARQPQLLYPSNRSYDHMFAWSASGDDRFVFASTNEPAERENLHIGAAADPTSLRRITDDDRSKSNPEVWSDPDRSLVFFCAGGKLASLQVEQASAKGSGIVLGEPFADGSEARVARNGKQLVWIQRLDAGGVEYHELRIGEVGGKLGHKLAALPGYYLRNPSWSPNSQLVAFYARPWRKTSWNLYVQQVPDPNQPGPAEPILLAEDVQVEEHFMNLAPAWSPSGTRLWYFSQAEAQEYYPLYWVSADGTKRGKLDYPYHLTTGQDVAVNPNPDLRVIVFCAIESLQQDVVAIIPNHE